MGAVPAQYLRPGVVFWGEQKVGRSSLLRALARSPLAVTCQDEAAPGFVFVCSGPVGQHPIWWRVGCRKRFVRTDSMEEARKWVSASGSTAGPVAAVEAVPEMPFSHLVLVDTPGLLGMRDVNTCDYLGGVPLSLLHVVVLDGEYFGTRHSMTMMRELLDRYPGRTAVVLNKVDQLEAEEIESLQARLARGLASLNAEVTPLGFTVSAAVECERREMPPAPGLRGEVRPEVIRLCDAEFDRFLVMLYGWESGRQARPHTPRLVRQLHGYLEDAFASQQENGG